MKKQILFFLAVLIILVGAYFFKNKNNNKAGSLLNVSFESIASFQINYFTQAVLFKKTTEGTWLVRKTKNELIREIEAKNKEQLFEETLFQTANSPEVSKVLTLLLLIKKQNAVATNRSHLAEFKINPHSLHVVLFDQNQKSLAKLFVGKVGPEPMSSFVKLDGDPNVYLARQNFNGLLNQEYSQWLAAGVAK